MSWYRTPVGQTKEIIVDNHAICNDGTWSTYSGTAPTYGADCLYKDEGDGTSTITWTPDIPDTGYYKVYAWWIEGSQRATNAQYTINYNGGSDTVWVNQKEEGSGGQWNQLGTEAYYFAAGTSSSVELSDDADGVVIADAIRFERVPGIIIDNSDATYVGTWPSTPGSPSPNPERYGDTFSYNEVGVGNDTATWTPDIPQAGNYRVYAWWTAYTNRATDAPYTIYYDGGSETIDVDQEVNGGRWNLLGTYPFAAGTSGSIVLSDDADDGFVIADATRFERVLKIIIIDNPEATCTWPSASGNPQEYGADFQYDNTPGDGDTCTWTPDIVQAGYYKVYAWWTDHTNRATDATYTINYNGGSDTVDVSQQASGGQWNYLGTYPFAVGTSGSVVLSDYADGVVIADAIRLKQAFDIIFDNDSPEVTCTWPSASGNPQEYGADFQYDNTPGGGDTCTWTPDIPQTGYYKVYAWWTAHTNRATDTPYTINCSSGSKTIDVNQQIKGGQWNYLGTYPFAVGTSSSVELSDYADGVVIADAIRLILQP